jgi:hypothetical protein
MSGMRRCLSVLLAAVAAYCLLVPAAFAAKLPVDLELVLAVDVSGSIDQDEAGLQRDGYVAAIADKKIVAAIRSGILGRIAVTYFEWAGEGWQAPVIDWRVIKDAASAGAFAAELARMPIDSGPWTSISGAIDFAVPLFAGNDFDGTRRVLDISGDGANNVGRMAPDARDDAVRRGIIINGLPIMNERMNISRRPIANLDLYYKNCVIGGPGAFIVVARNFVDFARAIRRKLILEIAGASPEPRAMLIPASADAPPPCDIGERRFRGFISDEW